MATKKEQSFINKFLSSKKQYPVLAAIASGLYPILFYFTNNYTIVSTWSHVGYFLVMFLCVPIVVFVIASKVSKTPLINKYGKYILPFLNVFTFLFFMSVCYYAGINKKPVLLSLIIALVFGLFFYKFSKKIIVVQLILALIGFVTLTPQLIKIANYSSDWTSQPDAIEEAVLKKRPNIYFIQPDGYANFSELKKGDYQIDNIEFEEYLKKENFKYYNDFRSNYASTLTSNSATFMMKHHYYNKSKSFGELLNARKNIISENTVLSILINNNYKTYFVTELPYLILNKTKIGYDESNLTLDDVSFIGKGLGKPHDIMEPLNRYLDNDTDKAKFFFIEIFNPGHIHGRKLDSEGIEGERNLWKESLERANEKLTQVISTIKEKDPSSLIVIMADHGGFVGMEYTHQIYDQTQDRDIVNSIFTSTLAIHWPQNAAPSYDDSLKSAVNVFRVLFSYLSENESYLQNLQPDESFVILKDIEPAGVYKYIDHNGNVILKKQ